MGRGKSTTLIGLSVVVSITILVSVVVVITQKGDTSDSGDISQANSPESSLSPSGTPPLPTLSPESTTPTLFPSPSTWKTSLPLTVKPSDYPSLGPSVEPSFVALVPTTLNDASALLTKRSSSPSACPSYVASQLFTTFYGIADVPYTAVERAALPRQIKSLPVDAEFLVHLGDIRSAKDFDRCRKAEYDQVATMLRASRVPVFIIVGDNEWNDCPNFNTAWTHWNDTFHRFDENWNHSFKVTRPSDRTENFAFVHKKTLFIGLNLVGGRVHRQSEWNARLADQVEWTKELILRHTGIDADWERARTAVIFGHANPSASHVDFFGPLRAFIQSELKNQIPIMYLNGDAHEWRVEPNFFDQPNYLRIQLTGGTVEPPLKIMINASHTADTTKDAFSYDRQL